MIKVPVKVRGDKINLEKGRLIDLKSTGKNPKSEYEIKSTTSDFSYDLSAAMYMDVFNAHFLCSDETNATEIKEFWWIYASKAAPVCKSWVGDDETIAIGRAKWTAGIRAIAKGIRDGWEFYDEPGFLAPQNFEREWLTKGENEEKQTVRFPRVEKLIEQKDEDLL